MPLINLIQEQRLAVKRNEAKARAFFFTFAAIAVGSVGAYGLVIFESEHAQSEVNSLKTQLRKNQPLVDKIAENAKEAGVFGPRLKTLEDAQASTDRWNRILHHVATQTPSNAWLTSLRTTAADATKPISVDFVGIATDLAPIDEFMQRLQNSSDLESVILKYSQEKLATNVKGTEFEISADISGSAEQKKTQEEAK
jgi:Tfp pilus assembly protein PilN